MADAQVTIYDIAQKLGVSAMTVSRALNGTGRISAETRARVKAAVLELGYRPNLSAKALNGGRTRVLGLLVSNILPQAMAAVVHAVGQAVYATDMNLIVYTNIMAHGADRAAEENVEQVLGSICDGLLVVVPGASPGMLADFERGNLPVVLLNYARRTSLPVVRGDNYYAAFAMVQYLVGLGHRRIAFITGTTHTGQSRERQRGYHDALLEAGIEPRAEWVAEGNFRQASGSDAALRLLALAERPTAIFAGNDEMALGAMEAARSCGLGIPGDVSIAGFDDIPSACHVMPKLTTIRQPVDEIGEAAVRLLQRCIEGVRTANRVEFDSELVIRDSCGPVPAA